MMRKVTTITVLALIAATGARAQLQVVREGNKLYREGRFADAVMAYEGALEKNPGDATAMYNRANALVKKGDKAAAMEGYEQLLATVKEPSARQRAWYDKGVLHQQQQQLDESISAWKEALKLDPEDQQARENLQKALREKKKQEEEKKKQEPQDKKDQQKKQPPPQQSKLTQKQVEQLLKAMEQKEKEIQKKMQQKNASPTQPEKDW